MDINGNALEIEMELICVLAGIYIAFESEEPKAGRAMLEYVREAIDTGSIERLAAKAQR